ncbi:MAG: DUF4358 domain-containing protein [Clostridiales Family XIII bacterium]|jgi:hypothetical protein|nr:DUF4358 domain-containing protein [Clostridiales Family XIII bacterium]
MRIDTPLRGRPRGLAGRGFVPCAIASACFLALAVLLAGCGGNRAGAEFDPRDLAKSLIDGITFDDQMEAASDNAFYALYAVDSSDESIAAFVLYTSTGATAEEVSVIEARDEESAETVTEHARARISSQKAEFKNYAPQEMAKLNDPVLVCAGKYVILCLSNDNAAAEKIIEDFLE